MENKKQKMKIKSIAAVVRYIKTKIKLQLWWKDWIKSMEENTHAKVVIIGTPLYGNLGDQALAIATYNFFEVCGIHEEDVLEIPLNIFEGMTAKKVKKIVRNRRVFIQAGGFMGNIWPGTEKQIQRIISLFGDRTIIILPQTITYSDDKEGRNLKEKSKKIYSTCDKLIICVREKDSISVAEELTEKKNIICVPDMVIGFLNADMKKNIRKKECLFCMRQDRERSITDELVLKLQLAAEKKGLKVNYTDTVLKEYIYPKERKAKVEQKLNEFAGAKLVVTDRLHGMLFAVITGTPCLFLDNINGKVGNVYEWIKDLDYVMPVADIAHIEEYLDKLLSLGEQHYSQDQYCRLYKKLIDIVKEKQNE